MSTDSKLRAQHPRLATYDMLAVKHLWDSHVNLTGLSLSYPLVFSFARSRTRTPVFLSLHPPVLCRMCGAGFYRFRIATCKLTERYLYFPISLPPFLPPPDATKHFATGFDPEDPCHTFFLNNSMKKGGGAGSL